MRRLLILLFVFSLTALHYAGIADAACTVSSTPVSFGSYDVFSSGPLDATGTITVDCNENPPPTVTISIRQSTNTGGFDPRAMKLTSGSELLSYNLYTDSNRTYIWGDGTGNTSTVSSKVFKNKPVPHTVYGRIPPIQNVSAGSYRETLTVTILW